ncbi:hypothetical protein [Oceanobacillus chungangensis]|uniref:Uncharacterized protein n=1 Tax=Oceanobacillus chungangensis TaxID=1229152 RepID=A0A3D8Q0W1_9BACI|nr:hypothetical protein [Oceanobacillus chungangensis]RDW21211.1 hypothetical protein CWR45_02905 [Oceanobacillus chungangensis]
MKSYLKLVNFEIGRFMKIYLVLIGLTILSQLIGVIILSKSYVANANEAIYEYLVPFGQFIEEYGRMSMMSVVDSIWFMGPIALCAAAFLFYIFFIWYRDWVGKNTFIYRLFMLPTARLNVLLSKATTIFLLVLGLVAMQLILLPIGSMLMKWNVPLDFRTDMTIREIINNSHYLFILIPDSFIQFLINYGLGFMAVFVLFTAILFERSFRWKGVLLGIVYCLIASAIFLAPLIYEFGIQASFFYPVELLIIEIILGILVIAISIWLSKFLLNKKVTV